jgi:hypothetical protein
MTFESELQKRTIRTSGEGFADGAQRNARIAAMGAAKRAASKSNKERQIASRTADAEKRTKEVMQMSKEETVTEAKHVFHVHLHPLDTRLGKMVDDKTVEPIGNKPKGDKIKLTIPATDTRSARDKATRYAAKNFGVDNVKSIEYKGLHEANIGPNVDTETIKGIHQRAHASITNPDNKNLTYSHPGFADSIDNEYKARKELAKRGIKVERPKHKAVFEETNTEKREKIKNVARMDDAEPTSEKSTLSKTGSIKTKIVEEKPTMSLPNFGLSASLIAAARQIVEKKDDVKLTGGKTQVEVEPETDDRSESDEDTSTSKKKKKLDPVGKEDDDIDNDGDSDKSDSYLKNRRKAIGKAIKEDEQLDEVSKKTLGSYVKKASDDATKHSYMAAKTGDLDTAAKASKRIRGIAKATDKLTKEDFTADELARIDEIAQSIFEVGTDGLDSDKKYAKGDVTNAVLSDEKKPGMDDDQHKHPMQQLEKIAHSVEGREPHFEHKDGSKTKVGKTLARQLKSVHDSMKTTQEKNKFADSVHASRDSMRAAADKHL